MQLRPQAEQAGLVPVKKLKPYSDNPKKHSPGQISQIAASIRAFGFMIPILVDRDFNVIAGHGRLLAAIKLGLDVVPVIQADHLTEDEVRAYRIADNKLAENAEWDNDLLRIELDYLVNCDLDVNVDITGFSTPEIDVILGAGDEDFIEEPESLPLPGDDETISRAGDLWVLGDHRVICADCRDPDSLKQLMAGEKAVAVITDPPYNVPIDGHVCGLGKAQHHEFPMASGEMTPEEFTAFLVAVLVVLANVSVKTALHYIFMDWRHQGELLAAAGSIYSQHVNCCVWVKSNGGMGSFYRSRHELVQVFKVGAGAHVNNVELGRHGRYRTNVWEYAGMNAFGEDRDEALAMHPTVKPVRMIADAILDASHHGDIVLDGFLGSGTTLLAAEQVGRRGYGIEIDPRYVDVAVRRWMALTGEPARLDGDGRTFDEITEARLSTSIEEV